MTDPAKNSPEETPPGAGGEGGGGQGGEGGAGGPGDPKPVSYETHRKLLSEKKAMAERLAALEAEKAERERKEAEAKGDYQKQLQLERERAQKLEDDLKVVREQETGRRKLAAVLTQVGGTIEPKFYDLVPYSDVVIDPDTGEVNALSVTKAVEKLKREYPEIIKAQGGPKDSNAAPGAGANGQGTISYSKWKQLPFAEMNKWKPSQIVDG